MCLCLCPRLQRGLSYAGVYLVTVLNRTPIAGWCVVRGGSNKRHHKDTLLKEIGLGIQILLPTPHSIANKNWEDLYSIKESTTMHFR